MKTIHKILLPLILLCQVLLGQTALADTQVANKKTVKINQTNIPANLQPIDIFKNPNLLADQWLTEPVPLSSYTEEEKRLQRLINDKTATAVQTYSTKAQDNEWTRYDHDEITPYTWKVLELDLTESNGKTFATSLLRPNWWIRNIGADRKGNRFYLKIPEVVEGWAVVKNIRVNQLDTRLWDEARKGDFVYRPVTATFQHDSNNVQQLYFTGNNTPLEVTPEHPIYSIDRNDFVHAGSLSIGEQVKTRQGITTLEQRKQLAGTHRVYNLEVYRDHNFMVSMDSILVHNSRDKGKALNTNSGSTNGIHQAINAKVDRTKPKYNHSTTPEGNLRPLNRRDKNVANVNAHRRENETFNLFAKEGYQVRILPETRGGNGYGIVKNKNPDMLVNGKRFDVYSPSSSNVRSIAKNVANKTREQAERVVVNLDDSPINPAQLKSQVNDFPIKTAQEIFAVKDGEIYHLYSKPNNSHPIK